jgi:hypothetical protein
MQSLKKSGRADKSQERKKRLALFRELFVGRSDAYVRGENGNIKSVVALLSKSVLKAHLAGEFRVGSYLIREDGRTSQFAFDIDENKPAIVRKIVRLLQELEITSYVERSKSKGFHVWVFLDRPTNAKKVRQFAHFVLRGLETYKIEVFPKQDKVPDGKFGNSIFLPLCGSDIPRNRTVFLDKNFDPIKKSWLLLRTVIKVSRDRLLACIREHCSEAAAEAPEEKTAGGKTGGRIANRTRNSTLAKIGGAMRRHGATKETIFVALREESQRRCDPPLPDEEVQEIASSISKYRPAEASNKGEAKQATRLVELAANTELFHSTEGDAYTTIQVNDHPETLCLKDSRFEKWLAAQYYGKFESTASAHALNEAIGALEGRALYKSPKKKVFTRIGEYKGALHLDLGDAKWNTVKITAEGWEIISNPRVKFRRPPAMAALPVPQKGGSIQDLRQFVNFASEDDFKLMVGWMIGALCPNGPYPILVLQGEAGSAKSTTARVLRDLVDPNTASLRSAPRNEQDLVIAAKNSWCIAYDNLSYTHQWQSDAVCRISTGSGFSTRKLYTDDLEQIFTASRPVLLNGIDGVVRRGDLMDRSILLYLPAIPAERRISEKQFWERFRNARPFIFGALLDALVCATKRIKEVHLQWQPRMADFARWVTAAEPALGWPEGGFLFAYKSNIASANKLVLEASPITIPLRNLCMRGGWTGTAANLLRALELSVGEQRHQKGFPQSAWYLSKDLRGIAPNLRVEGLDIQFDRKTAGSDSKRIITITKCRAAVKVEGNPGISAQIRRFPREHQRFPRD